MEEKWKMNHYIGYQANISDPSNGCYLQILRDFHKKAEIQLNFEKE
jgi:hypothetical protein